MPQESRPERDGAKESDARTASSCFFPKFSLLFLRLRVRSKKTEESISTFDLWALSKLSPTLTLHIRHGSFVIIKQLDKEND